MTTELIIYLEPSYEVRQYIESFLEECKERFGPTTANKYGCHITMVGFFDVDNEAQQEDLKNKLDSLLKKFKTTSLPIIEIKPFLVTDKETRESVHLLLPVTSPEPYHQLMRELAKYYPMLRLKRINHISLAYWDEPEATRLEQEHWKKSRKEIFQQIQEYATQYFKQLDSTNMNWDVVLYKRKVKGDHVGEKHVFEEIQRWHTQITKEDGSNH
ncbi:hypothetical protein BDF20DRAFT_387550 [Mycotypha africana]|uniref:uncharacterized protein n=1 Tax=Mycotypha africana TaxID=64632 RepID=UPI0022FFC480|nr:uncharacterized protein BDF20DRAFT_387550 [Mycotypha africana]KAI8984406.1 hypothetical protein BDF20DRAFT_387550 [Mycotypha africana]